MNDGHHQTDSSSTCPDQRLLVADVVRPQVLPAGLRKQLLEHLCVCSDCAAFYE